MTTIDTITTEQIETLRDEANAHGDTEMARLCDLALDGDETATAACVKAIQAAEAMA